MSARRIIAILLLLGLPLCIVGAGAYASRQPRIFSAATSFQLLHPDVDHGRMNDAFEKAQRQYSSLAQARIASRVQLSESSAPDHFRITAIDADPLTTANTANTLTILTSDGLQNANKENGRRMNILQKAEMPKIPTLPNVCGIMTFGVSLGLLCGVGGAVLLAGVFKRNAG